MEQNRDSSVTLIMLDMLPLVVTAILVMVGVFIATHYAPPSESERAAAAEKIAAGTLKSLSVETSWFGDTSTMTLEDGTTVRLSGTFNPWKTGEAVTKAQVKYDDKAVTYWCAGQTCLKQQ